MFNYARLILLHITRGLPQAPRRGWILPQRGLIPRGIPSQAAEQDPASPRSVPGEESRGQGKGEDSRIKSGGFVGKAL